MKKYVVTVGHERFVFSRKYMAIQLVNAVVAADGVAVDYSQKETNSFSPEFPFPDVAVWTGDWIDKDEVTEGITENAQFKQLQDDLESAQSKATTEVYYKGVAEKKSEAHELEVCRLAGVLEANGLDKDGKAVEQPDENEEAAE